MHKQGEYIKEIEVSEKGKAVLKEFSEKLEEIKAKFTKLDIKTVTNEALDPV